MQVEVGAKRAKRAASLVDQKQRGKRSYERLLREKKSMHPLGKGQAEWIGRRRIWPRESLGRVGKGRGLARKRGDALLMIDC